MSLRLGELALLVVALLVVLIALPVHGQAAENTIGELATEEEFNNDRMPPFALVLRVGPEEMKKGKVLFQFGSVPAGTYAIRCFQDVNENQKLDRGVFGPKEPWGVYRPKRPAFRGPKFEEISFSVDRDIVDVLVEVK